ncbi:MAG: hypothetical protein EBZ96_09045, partial [Synechococcaceae bacterium WB9_3_282]|nr:hypothetical protein [Synechococcaceae bacterium WB9_3_282]
SPAQLGPSSVAFDAGWSCAVLLARESSSGNRQRERLPDQRIAGYRSLSALGSSLELAALCHRRREQDPGGRPDQRLTATQGQASGQVSVVSIKKRLPEVNTNQQY